MEKQQMGVPQSALRAGSVKTKLRRRKGIRRETPGNVRSGIRTGTAAHFAFWMADLRIKSQLQRISLARLADGEACVESAAVSGYAILYVGGIKNVWDLSRTPLPVLLGIRGIEVEHLAAIEEELKGRNVSLVWTVS